MTTIEDVIARIPDWRGRSLSVRPVTGGLTNRNYRVEVDGTPYVVRIPGGNAAMLAIDPAHAYHNSLVAAHLGIGAMVVLYLPELSVMVLEFIAGQTLSSCTMREPGMLARVVDTVRRLHAGPSFANSFSLFRTMDAYLATVRRYDIALPDGYAGALKVARRIEEALEAWPLPLVPSHNDLMPENFIDDGSRLRLVDYDYSGTNDPSCDLGYICNEGELSPHQVEELCVAYFGQASKRTLARAWLYRCMTNIVSTLWGAIQHNMSEIPYDYWGLALERWRRAQDLLDSPEFGLWLRDVRTG